MKKIQSLSFDMVISTGGPYSVHRVGLSLKKQNPELKWIVDWRDLWTCNQFLNGLKIFLPYEKYLEKKFHNNADLITTVSEPSAATLRNMTKTKVEVIYNGYDPDDYINIKQRQRKNNDSFTIVYTGTIYKGFQDPSPLFKAVSNLKDNNFLATNNLQIIFAGENANMSDIAECYHISEFYSFIGILPREDALKLQYDADALLYLDYINPSIPGILAGKLFEYLYIAREIMAVGIDNTTTASEFINKTQTGICFGTDVKRIERYLREKITNKMENNLVRNDKLIQEFERKNQAIKIIDLVKD
jgi:glycosyltransferase involved in cell wall biosynthesis